MDLNQYLTRYTGSVLTLVGPLLQEGRAFSSEPVIFVDGGACYRKGKEGFSVGDGDSHASLDETIPARKDFSDLAYVLAAAHQYNKVDAWGFWGGRRDHELANLGEFHQFLKKRKNAEVSLPPHARGFSAGIWTFELEGLFSLFVLERSELQITGETMYPVHQARTFEPLSSLGLSNEGHGRIQIQSAKPFFLFYQF